MEKSIWVIGLGIICLFCLPFVLADIGIDENRFGLREDVNYSEEIVNLTTNKSDYWDNLDTPADILGSLINNDLGWITTAVHNDNLYNSTAWNRSGTNVFLANLGDDLQINNSNGSIAFGINNINGALTINDSGEHNGDAGSSGQANFTSYSDGLDSSSINLGCLAGGTFGTGSIRYSCNTESFKMTNGFDIAYAERIIWGGSLQGIITTLSSGILMLDYTNEINLSTSYVNIGWNGAFGTGNEEGNLRVRGYTNITSSLNQTQGNATINMHYAEAFHNSTNVTTVDILATDTYVILNNTFNFTEGLSQGARWNGSGVITPVGGVYNINYYMSFSGGNGDEIHLSVGINDNSSSGKCHSSRDAGSASAYGNTGATCNIRTSDGDIVYFIAENDADNEDFTIQDGGFTLTRVGN